MKFTRISQDAFEEIQTNAGILLKKFDPTGATEVADEDIVTATTGGITASCVPSYSDWGEDVDNCPNNMMEMMELDTWDCRLSCVGLGTSPEFIKLSLGAADVADGKITPRRDLKQTDFADIWWVGDRADGGMVAIRLINALSTSGFSLKTTKKGKGQISIELTGHVSIENQTLVPMEFYVSEGDGTAEASEGEQTVE